MFLQSLSHSKALTPREAFSGIFGSISLAVQLLLLIPQLILNYKNGSADAISLAFLGVWMIGDLANLSGAIWASLIPIVILQAIYFCLSDGILISQCLYYKYISARNIDTSPSSSTSTPSEEAPLLRSHLPQSPSSPGKKTEKSAWIYNTLSLVAVIVAGTAGWAVAYYTSFWIPSPAEESIPNTSKTTPIGAELLGYLSAVCYLSARIPQIAKNYREKSCDGLSLLFFILSITGNLTYGASILCHSLEKNYLATNLPWLIGSLGTLAEDVVIFLQFRIYSKNSEPKDDVHSIISA
ncbi:hypothetical protein K3495_g11909 [Podosphaera aphanis]|nr:hypothetical protein K3495_g11909 [Podosphaera aphanis]